MPDIERDRSFVIYHYPNSYRYALLSQQHGRVNGLLFDRVLSIGSCIEYSPLSSRGSAYQLKDIQLIALPLDLARQYLAFLHHIFEICFYFVPLGSPGSELFELLHFLYTVDSKVWTVQNQKIIVAKLLITIGYYPEITAYDEAWLTRWRSTPIEELTATTLSAQALCKIDRWLRICIAEHPQIMVFKTTNFLKD